MKTNIILLFVYVPVYQQYNYIKRIKLLNGNTFIIIIHIDNPALDKPCQKYD